MTPPKTPNEVTIERLLRNLTRAIMRRPETLSVSIAEIGPTIKVDFKCPREDCPALVGAQGKTIWAIKAIFAAVGRKMGKAIDLKLLEPTEGTKTPMHEFKADPHWKPDQTRDLLTEILTACCSEPYDLKIERHETFHAIKVEPLRWKQDKSACWNTGELPIALQTLFKAAGMKQGRILHLEAYDAQPVC